MKCGKQHLALDDALKKWNAWISALLISAITSGIIFSIFRWLEFGIISFCIELAMVIAPIGGVYGFYQEISEEIGEPLIHYLTPEQKKKCVGTVLGAVALTLVIGLFGASIWNQILGA